MTELRIFLTLIVFSLGSFAFAQGQSTEAQIQKRLQERIPEIGRIDEVRKTSMPGFSFTLLCFFVSFLEISVQLTQSIPMESILEV